MDAVPKNLASAVLTALGSENQGISKGSASGRKKIDDDVACRIDRIIKSCSLTRARTIKIRQKGQLSQSSMAKTKKNNMKERKTVAEDDKGGQATASVPPVPPAPSSAARQAWQGGQKRPPSQQQATRAPQQQATRAPKATLVRPAKQGEDHDIVYSMYSPSQRPLRFVGRVENAKGKGQNRTMNSIKNRDTRLFENLLHVVDKVMKSFNPVPLFQDQEVEVISEDAEHDGYGRYQAGLHVLYVIDARGSEELKKKDGSSDTRTAEPYFVLRIVKLAHAQDCDDLEEVFGEERGTVRGLTSLILMIYATQLMEVLDAMYTPRSVPVVSSSRDASTKLETIQEVIIRSYIERAQMANKGWQEVLEYVVPKMENETKLFKNGHLRHYLKGALFHDDARVASRSSQGRKRLTVSSSGETTLTPVEACVYALAKFLSGNGRPRKSLRSCVVEAGNLFNARIKTANKEGEAEGGGGGGSRVPPPFPAPQRKKMKASPSSQQSTIKQQANALKHSRQGVNVANERGSEQRPGATMSFCEEILAEIPDLDLSDL